MSTHIVDNHIVFYCPADADAFTAANTKQNLCKVLLARTADVTLGNCIEHTTLETVANCIVEYGNAANGIVGRNDLSNVALVCLLAAINGGTHRPAFTIDQGLGIDGVNCGFNLLHSCKVVQTHQVKAQTVKLVFLHPVSGRLYHKLAVHIALGSGIVSASACGAVSTRRGVSVIVVRNDAVKGAVCIIGVVVNNVHYNADACCVQRLHHLLVFLDTNCTVEGVGGVAALGNVIVFGIVAPVELGIGIAFVNSCIVVYGQQVNVSNAELLEIINAYGLTVLVDKTGLCESKILALVLRGSDLVGEVSYVYFPDNCLGVGRKVAVQSCCIPTVGIGERKVNNHTSVAVYARCLCIGVNSLLGSNGGGNGVGVICTVSALFGVRPYTLFALDHFNGLVGFYVVPCLKEVEQYFGCGGCPYLKGGIIAVDICTEIVTVIVEVLGKIVTIKNIGGNDCLRAIALDFNAVVLGKIEVLANFDVARNCLLAKCGDLGYFNLSVALIYFYLIQAGNYSLGSEGVFDFCLVYDACQGKLSYHFECLSSIITFELIANAGLKIDDRFSAFQNSKTVLIKVLGCIAPRAATGLGAIAANDKSNLADAFGNVNNYFCTVVAFVEQVSLACYVAPPDPNVTILVGISVISPIKGELIVAILKRQTVFVFRHYVRRLGGVIRSGLFRSGFGSGFIGVLLILAGCKCYGEHHNKHQQ